MSLLNDMLSDLQRRHYQLDEADDKLARSLYKQDLCSERISATNTTSTTTKMMAVAGLGALLLLGTSDLYENPHKLNILSSEKNANTVLSQAPVMSSARQAAGDFPVTDHTGDPGHALSSIERENEDRSNTVIIHANYSQKPETGVHLTPHRENHAAVAGDLLPLIPKGAHQSVVTIEDHSNPDSFISDTVSVPVSNALSQYSYAKQNANPENIVSSHYENSRDAAGNLQSMPTDQLFPGASGVRESSINPPLESSVIVRVDEENMQSDKHSQGSAKSIGSASRSNRNLLNTKQDQNDYLHATTVEDSAAEAEAEAEAEVEVEVEVDNSESIKVTRRPASTKQQYLRDYQKAADLYRQGHFTDAKKKLENLLERDMAQHKARLLLARLYLNQKLDNHAELTLNDGLMLFPNYIPYVNLYAQMLANQGRDTQAIEVLQKSLSMTNDNASIHALLAGLYQRNGDSSAATSSYLTALELTPNRGEWWVGLAVASEQAGDRVTAEKAYSEAMQHQLSNDVEQYAVQRLQHLAVNKIPDDTPVNK